MLDVRITRERRHLYISTGVKVRRSEWVAGRVVNRMDANVLNDRLAIIYKKVGDEVNAATSEGRNINAEEIRKRVFAVKEEYSGKDTLLEWIAEQIPMLNIEEGTRKHYMSLQHRLDEYGRLKRWQDVTVEGIYEFDAWLHTRHKPISKMAVLAGVKPERLSDAGIYKYHKCLKALLNRADRFGKIDRNPYERLKGQFKRGDKENPEYLTEDEMGRIQNVSLSYGGVLDVARDLFVFQMFTGLAYSDAVAFDFSRYKLVDGTWRYVGSRIKTGVPYVSELLPPAVKVLQKYGGKTPQINNADYNHRLKEIGRIAKIDTRLHSHLARHSFATMMLRNGAKIENVSKMLGHTNITQTQRYAKTLAQSVHEDYKKIRAKWK